MVAVCVKHAVILYSNNVWRSSRADSALVVSDEWSS